MSIRLQNPCEDLLISEELREKTMSLQKRCVECGNASRLEIHHRIFKSQYTPLTMKHFMEERSKVFGKDIYWDLNSGQNLVMLCTNCHGKLHNGYGRLAEKYRESFTDTATGNNIFYDRNDYSKYKNLSQV